MAPWRADCVCEERILKLSLDSPLYVNLVKGMPIVFVVAPVGSPTSCITVAWAGTGLMTNKNRVHRWRAGPGGTDPGWEESVCCLHVGADGLYLHFTEIEMFRNCCVKEGLINHV